MTQACGMWRLTVAMALRKFCNTLEDSDEIVCGCMCVLDLNTKIKRFIEFKRVFAGKTQFLPQPLLVNLNSPACCKSVLAKPCFVRCITSLRKGKTKKTSRKNRKQARIEKKNPIKGGMD